MFSKGEIRYNVYEHTSDMFHLQKKKENSHVGMCEALCKIGSTFTAPLISPKKMALPHPHPGDGAGQPKFSLYFKKIKVELRYPDDCTEEKKNIYIYIMSLLAQKRIL